MRVSTTFKIQFSDQEKILIKKLMNEYNKSHSPNVPIFPAHLRNKYMEFRKHEINAMNKAFDWIISRPGYKSKGMKELRVDFYNKTNI